MGDFTAKEQDDLARAILERLRPGAPPTERELFLARQFAAAALEAGIVDALREEIIAGNVWYGLPRGGFWRNSLLIGFSVLKDEQAAPHAPRRLVVRAGISAGTLSGVWYVRHDQGAQVVVTRNRSAYPLGDVPVRHLFAGLIRRVQHPWSLFAI